MEATKLNTFAANSQLPFSPGVRLVSGEDIKDILCPGFSLQSEVRLHVPINPVLGHMTFQEMAVLTALAVGQRAGRILEFGTFDGLTDRFMLDNLPDLTRLVTVDLPDDLHATPGIGLALEMDPVNTEMIGVTTVGWRTAKHPRRDRITSIRSDSALVSKETLLAATGGEPYDLTLVDGAHTYDYCKSDTALALQVTRPGGLVVWHDFNKVKFLPGVTRYLLELAQEREIYWIQGPELDTSLVVTQI